MLSEDGKKVAIEILQDLKKGYLIVPGEIALQELSRRTGVSPQNIGMAFDPYVIKPLENQGYMVRKCGKPARIEVMSLG